LDAFRVAPTDRHNVEGNIERKMEKTSGEQVVTPWDVVGVIDYNKLIDQFGCTAIDDSLLERMERITGKPVHPWLRRGLFFSHR